MHLPGFQRRIIWFSGSKGLHLGWDRVEKPSLCAMQRGVLLAADPVPDPFQREALSSRGFFLLPFLQLV